MSEESFPQKVIYALLVPAYTLCAFFVLYSFRHIDDNRLTSWKWAFANVELAVFIPVFVAGIITALLLFRLSYIKRRPALFLFFISFAVASIFWKVPEVIVDTSRYFAQAKHLEIYGIKYFSSEWGRDINAWTDMPLLPFLYGIIFKFFGESRAYIQLFTTLTYSATIVITFFIGKTLWDEDTGFYAGALLMGIPYIYSQVPLMLVDVPAMFLLTLSTYTFIKGVERGGAWIAYSSMAIFCAILSKYSMWMMLSVLVIVLIIYLIVGQRDRKRVIFRASIVALIVSVLIGVVFLFKYDVIFSQIKLLNEYQRPGLRRWGESFISTYFYQVNPFITIAALCSVYFAIRKRDLKFLIISWLILLVVVFQIRRSRYVMVTFPMLTLMAAYGFQRIKSIEIKKYIIPCIVGYSLVIAIYAYLPFLQKMSLGNLRAAGEYLISVDVEKIAVFTIPSDEAVVNQAVSVPILDLYTDKEISYYYITDTLPYEEIAESPLRFTWTYKNPEYYSGDRPVFNSQLAVVVISNGPYETLPGWIKEKIAGFQQEKVFDVSTGIFKYNPNVSIYLHQ